MDDYYELLGVDTDAARDEIRAAYRERKDALDGSTDAGKAEAAQLNKAWNVLSDPYQRGRYDERLTTGGDDDEDDEVLTEVQSNGKSSTRAKKSAPPPRTRKGREMPPPTIDLPAGTKFPAPKQRIIAMAIDVVVLLVLVLGAQLLGDRVAKNQHPAEYKIEQQQRDHAVPDAQKAQDAAKKTLDNAKKAVPPDQAAIQKAQAEFDAAKKNTDDQTKTLNDAAATLAPWRQVVSGLAFLLGFLYLAIPSALTGRTLGKRTQHLKALRADGAPLGWRGAVLRYGLLVGVTFLLSFVLGPLAAVLVIVGVTTWLRNPNMQGLHDRWTHTIVVADA